MTFRWVKSGWSWIIANSDLVLCLLLFGVSATLVRGITHESPDQAVTMATLAGSLFGGGGVLLANWINRWNDRQRAVRELTDKRAQLKAMIGSELVNVAAGLIGAHEFIRAALNSQEAMVPMGDLRRHFPREMAFTESLGSEVLALERPAINALASLRSNLAITRMQMEEIATAEGGAWHIHVTGLLRGVNHTIGVLAESFEHIAPDSQLALQGRPPELASKILSRLAESEPLEEWPK